MTRPDLKPKLNPAPNQDAPSPASVLSKSRFAGRSTLRVLEVAEALCCTEQHVLNLIDRGKLDATNIGNGSRGHWRILVSSFDQFVEENKCGAVPVRKTSEGRGKQK